MIKEFFMLMIGDVTTEQKKAMSRVFFRGILVLHISWACGWMAWLGLHGFAQAGEVDTVKSTLSSQLKAVQDKADTIEKQVSKVQRQQQRGTMETEIRRLDQEIFNIEARIKELTSAGLRADRIYDERLSDLRGQKARIEARLSGFMRANPDIAGDPL